MQEITVTYGDLEAISGLRLVYWDARGYKMDGYIIEELLKLETIKSDIEKINKYLSGHNEYEDVVNYIFNVKYSFFSHSYSKIYMIKKTEFADIILRANIRKKENNYREKCSSYYINRCVH